MFKINTEDFTWKEWLVLGLVIVFAVSFLVTYIAGTICIMSIEPPAR